MKQPILFIIALGLFGCNQQTGGRRVLQNRMDTIESRLADTYRPGFGEFMSTIQSHHAKLWFAGNNQNWKLADFEINEIMETIEDIQKYQSEREESQIIGMIHPALDSVNIAIEEKNLKSFIGSYTLLTNTCNKCHRTTNFEFNVVKIPDIQTFSNQDFQVH